MATTEGDDLAGLSAGAARVLSGFTGRDLDCQNPGGPPPAFRHPWHGDDRQDDKTRIWRYVRQSPSGVPLSKVVRDIFGQDAVESAGGDYQLARRLIRECDYFKTTRGGRDLWVEPTLSAFNLSPQYANRKTTGGRGDGLSNGREGVETGGDDRADSPTFGTDGVGDAVEPPKPRYPKDRARGVLSKRTVLDDSDGGHDYRQELLRELATERDLQADKYQIFERVRGQGDDYLLIPYLTRFNSRENATGTQSRFRAALGRASEAYRDAVVLTVTTDPKRHDGLTEALDSLSENKNRLLSWLASDYQLGERPENRSVLEFSESGLPHYHIVLFGRSWLMHHRALSAKWDDLGAGSVIDVRTASERGGRWLMHNDDGGTVTVREYLGKSIRGLVDLAGMDNDDLQEAVEDGDVSDLWRHALYWATGRQYCSCSPSLKEPTEEGLPHVTVWRFRGVSRYGEIPSHVRHGAVVLRRRPPPASGSRTASAGAD
jgi:hypothetical protein